MSVGKPGDVRGVTLSAHELTLKAGESASIDVEIQRADGFDKNLILEVNYMHLSAVYGDSLPQRQKIVVMANVSLNFVMKATYASDPVYVTVKQ